MARLYSVRPNGIRVYHCRAPSPDRRAAALGFCLTLVLAASAAFGIFLIVLVRLSPFYRDFFDRHGYDPEFFGVPLLITPLIMFVFNLNRTYLEFREEEEAVIHKGLFTRTRIARFSELGDIRLETLRLDNGGVMFQYLVFWKDELLKNPIPLSPPVDSAYRLETHGEEIVPLLRQMLERSTLSAGTEEPAVHRARIVIKPFFTRQGAVHGRAFLFEPMLWLCLAAGMAAWAYFCDYWIVYRTILIVLSLAFCVAIFFEHTALYIDTDKRIIVEHTCLGLRKREYPLSAFGRFMVMHMPPLVEVVFRSLNDAGPKVTIGTFVSFETAKEALQESASIVGIDYTADSPPSPNQ